jgi:hypothetical protein
MSGKKSAWKETVMEAFLGFSLTGLQVVVEREIATLSRGVFGWVT